jgi:biotin carboxyl carrier protein
VPDARRESPAQPAAGSDDRIRDHAAIGRLADGLLPALIAKLSATHLGELEVREGDWRVRLRRPVVTWNGEDRRTTDKPSRSQPGHEGHGHPRGAPETHRPARVGVAAGYADATPTSGNGTGLAKRDRASSTGAQTQPVATSPAVGVFQPGQRAIVGTRVRSGDTLGAVDVLGVPQDVVAPVDGVVGATLVEAGTAVEYGQELVRIELAAPAEAR